MHTVGLEWKDLVKFSVHHSSTSGLQPAHTSISWETVGFSYCITNLLPRKQERTKKKKKSLDDIQFQGSQDTHERNFNNAMKEAEIGF